MQYKGQQHQFCRDKHKLEHQEVGTIMNRTANWKFKNYSYNTSDTNLDYNSNSKYLPGDNLQICVNHWTGRILEHPYDPKHLGRWTGHKFRLQGNKTLSVITGYQPCVYHETIHNNLHNRANEVFVSTFLENPPKDLERTLNIIDWQITEAVLRAEQ
jgi:hypothetical protein